MYLPGPRPTCARLFVCSDVSTLCYVSDFSLAWSLSHGAQQLVGDVQIEQKEKSEKRNATPSKGKTKFTFVSFLPLRSRGIIFVRSHYTNIVYNMSVFSLSATPQQSIFFPMFCLQRQLFHLMFTLFFGIVFALLLNCSAMLEQQNGCS